MVAQVSFGELDVRMTSTGIQVHYKGALKELLIAKNLHSIEPVEPNH